jgi:hypothetical protein
MGFGASLDLDAERALVGAPYLDAFSGAAYVFELQAGGWAQVAKLVASDPAPDDGFGQAVSLDGERALVGASGDDTLAVNSGAVYVFERHAGAWVQTAKLPPGGTSIFFGMSVSLEGDRALIGSLQGAFVFELQGGAWVRTADLLASVPPGTPQGWAVSLSHARALVGSPLADSAHVFELHGNAWVETAELVAGSTSTYYFGGSVSLEGDRALIGDRQEMDLGSGLGTAHVFDYVAGSWIESAVLVPTDPDPFKLFADCVALRGDRALVGAPGDHDSVIQPGAAYLYEASGGSWTQVAKLAPAAPEGGEVFGDAVALGEGRALVGAWGADVGGAAFLIDVSHASDALQASPSRASLGLGGTQTFALNAGPGLQGQVFWLLGSLSGTAPGIPVGGGLVLPLNPDAYLVFGVLHSNLPPLDNSLGLLGPTGQASAAFGLPPGTDPSLAGLTLHHAYAVLDLGSLTPLACSNPVALHLVP